MRRPASISILLASTVLIGACGSLTPAKSSRRDEVNIRRMPPDFAISVTILTPGNTHPDGTPSWLVPAWYMVEADGSLRAQEGVRRPTTRVPPVVRQLSQDDVEALWSTIRAGGLAGPASDVTSESTSVVAGVSEIPTEGVVAPTAALYISGDLKRRAYQVDLRAEDSASRRTRDLTARLAQLAGIGESPSP